jgi:hypothetical protein
MPTDTRVPIICSATLATMASCISAKRMPATAMGPISGRRMRPSRPTVSV